MSRKLKKMLSIICMMCLLVNLLMVHASGDMHLEMGTIELSNRIPVLTLSVGSGAGQVGYGGIEASGYIGADSFAVEDGVIFILDGVNQRVLIYANGEYGSIDISGVPRARHMKYENKMIAVSDNTNHVTGIYSLAGTQIALIPHLEIIEDELVDELVEVSDSYVVWRTYDNNLYRYDWETDTIAEVEEPEDTFTVVKNADAGVASVSSVSSAEQWSLNAENKRISVHGAKNNALIYDQYECVPNVDMFFVEFSIRKVAADGSESYAIIDFSDWMVHPLEPTYLSSDGEVYLLEGFEDRVVISKIVFGTTDVSRMDELEALAEARRAEVARSEQVATMSTTSNVANVTRIDARKRAKEMIDYEWQVLANHKTSSNSTVVVPRYVKEATTGTYVTGIPYCWGGYNGWESEDGYPSFASLVTSTAYTAGNTGDYEVSTTIGLDCSGYLSSVYNLPTKYNTAMFANYGHAVTQDQLKPMDFFVKRVGNAGHVSLFEGWNEDGDVLIIYECDVTEKNSANVYLNGKTLIEEWGITFVVGSDGNTSVNDGFICRSPFHEGTCNASGISYYNVAYHEVVCTICEYVWPFTKQIHDENGGWREVEHGMYHAPVCSVCGGVGRHESHDENGAIKIEEGLHIYTCSKCGAEGDAHEAGYGDCEHCN